METLDRIVELWPSLSHEARQEIVEIAERSASRELALALSDREGRLLARALEDFRQGRALDADAYRSEMDAYFDRLVTQSKT